MTPEEFDGLFDTFRSTVVRVEALPEYRVGGAEAERIAAARSGRPRPLRTVRTSPWLARMAVSTVVERKSWLRVRVVGDPLTAYEDYELAGYRESQACGEEILIARRADVGEVGQDFWLFDAGTPGQRAALMVYGPQGEYQGAELVTDPDILARYRDVVARLRPVAVPLNDFLADIGRG